MGVTLPQARETGRITVCKKILRRQSSAKISLNFDRCLLMVIPVSWECSFFTLTLFSHVLQRRNCSFILASCIVFWCIHFSCPNALLWILMAAITSIYGIKTRMHEELTRCLCSAKDVIGLIAAVRAGSYNMFTCSIRNCSHEPAVEWLAPDVLHGRETGLIASNEGDEEMCFLSQEKDEKGPRWFEIPAKKLYFYQLELHLIRLHLSVPNPLR